MYLKAVELIGFKSFADKTTIEFTPGITSIVGPNGCGKSNVADAVRWVLGERSAKMLRGRKMEDVIFAGTHFRKPLNMAQVNLVIDNRDRILSIGYEEVVLTRSLYRTGESEYFINKTPCRYKDIQDLILDTGIGSHSYSMIEQGRIDYILQADPDERRFLIEEAAGISKFKSQKDEAIRKLERTENNLLRLTDIVTEVERNIKYAERQAKRAQKYRGIFDSLKQKEIQKALLEIQRLEERAQKLKDSQHDSHGKEQNLSSRVEILKQAVLNLEKEEEEKLQELRFQEGKRYERKAELQNRENTKAFNFEKIGEMKNQVETLEREIRSIDENQEGLLASLKEAEAEPRVSDSEAEASALDGRIQELEVQERKFQDQTFEGAGALASLRNEIQKLEVEKASCDLRSIKNEELSQSSKEESAAIRSKRTQLEGDLTYKKESLSTLKVEETRLASELESLEGSIQNQRMGRENQLKEFQDVLSRLQILEELESSLFETGSLQPEILERLKATDFGQSFLTELKSKPGFEKGLEEVLGSLLKSMFVERVKDLRETLLEQRLRSEKGLESSDTELAQLEKELGSLRRCSQESIEAFRTRQFELEVEEGQFGELKKLLSEGEKKLEYCETEARLISRESEEVVMNIKEQKAQFQTLEDTERDLKAQFDRLRDDLQKKRLEKSALKEKLRYKEDAFESLQRQVKESGEMRDRHERQMNEAREKIQKCRAENESLDTEIENYRETLKGEELNLHQCEEARLTIHNKKKSASEELTQEEKSLEEIRSQFHQLQMENRELEHLSTRERDRLAQTYKIKLEDFKLSEEEIDSLELSTLENEIAELQEKVSNIGTVNLLAVEEYEELKQRFDFLANQKQDLEKARQELLEAIRKINRTTRKLFRETFEKVRHHFSEFFRILFGGGVAELVILDEDNPLDSGIDIFVRPPGKKTQNISLLSGGEKALSAIALLFALFKIKPSPFSILDEVDAPLDEANIDRFLDVLKTFTDNTQFIIVTHNRKTISMCSTIFGVTMQEAGVSKVVAVKLQPDDKGGLQASLTGESVSSTTKPVPDILQKETKS